MSEPVAKPQQFYQVSIQAWQKKCDGKQVRAGQVQKPDGDD